jgi:long-chain acyl-CoA synthetase
VREYSTAQQVTVPSTGNLTDDVVTNGTEYADAVVFSRRVEGAWADVTAAEFLAEVRGVAKGLIAAGIEAGDRVALISRTRYEWTLLDYAIWFAGAATVPVYETSSAAQVEWILTDSGARAVFTETQEHSSRVKGVRDGLPDLHHVWSIDGSGLGILRTLGEDVSDEEL